MYICDWNKRIIIEFIKGVSLFNVFKKNLNSSKIRGRDPGSLKNPMFSETGH